MAVTVEMEPLAQLRECLDSGQPEVVLAGCAGTGKTTLIRGLRTLYGERNVLLCAPTNKAAKRLREVTGLPCVTVHHLIYGAAIPIWIKPDGTQCEGYATSVVDTEGNLVPGPIHPPPGCPGCKCTSRMYFGAPKEIEAVRLLVVDEASMVGAELAADIRAAIERQTRVRVQILWVGDPAQLPPVLDRPGVRLQEPDVLLTKVWRADGGILGLATAIRSAQSFTDLGTILARAARGAYRDVTVRPGRTPEVGLWKAQNLNRMTIVHTNRDRQAVNARVRELVLPTWGHPRGHQAPVPWDRFLVRQNARDAGVLNSEVYEALTVDQIQPGFYAVVAVGDGEVRRFNLVASHLGDEKNEDYSREARKYRESVKHLVQKCAWCTSMQKDPGREALELEVAGDPYNAQKHLILADYLRTNGCTCSPGAGAPLVNTHWGYAITAHVAQGSEADEVGVYWTQGTHRGDFATARSWLYTAVTRAKRSLTVFS